MPRFRCLLTLAAFVVSGCSLLAWPFSSRPLQSLETSVLFHPAKASEQWLDPPAQLYVEDVWLKTADGTRIHAWWAPSLNSTGTILFCHGNAGNLSHRGSALQQFQSTLGQSVLIFDYPGYGKSEGTPDEPSCYASAQAAFDWLTETQHIPADRIILFGESLGGGVATEMAIRRPHRALFVKSTFTSIPNMARTSALTSSSASLVRNQFDNLAKIGRCPRPVYIAHGDRDQVIPLPQGQQLYQAAPSPKRFFLLKGSGHNDALPTTCLNDLADFLRSAEGN